MLGDAARHGQGPDAARPGEDQGDPRRGNARRGRPGGLPVSDARDSPRPRALPRRPRRLRARRARRRTRPPSFGDTSRAARTAAASCAGCARGRPAAGLGPAGRAAAERFASRLMATVRAEAREDGRRGSPRRGAGGDWGALRLAAGDRRSRRRPCSRAGALGRLPARTQSSDKVTEVAVQAKSGSPVRSAGPWSAATARRSCTSRGCRRWRAARSTRPGCSATAAMEPLEPVRRCAATAARARRSRVRSTARRRCSSPASRAAAARQPTSARRSSRAPLE